MIMKKFLMRLKVKVKKGLKMDESPAKDAASDAGESRTPKAQTS